MVGPDVSSGGQAFCRLTQRAGGGCGASEVVGLRQDGAVVGADSVISSPEIPLFFFFGCAGSSRLPGFSPGGRVGASHCGDSSCCGAQAPVLQACGIFPDKGLNPCLLHWPSAEVL